MGSVILRSTGTGSVPLLHQHFVGAAIVLPWGKQGKTFSLSPSWAPAAPVSLLNSVQPLEAVQNPVDINSQRLLCTSRGPNWDPAYHKIPAVPLISCLSTPRTTLHLPWNIPSHPLPCPPPRPTYQPIWYVLRSWFMPLWRLAQLCEQAWLPPMWHKHTSWHICQPNVRPVVKNVYAVLGASHAGINQGWSGINQEGPPLQKLLMMWHKSHK